MIDSPSIPNIVHTRLAERQKRAFEWAKGVWGAAVVTNRRYQALRGLEEYLELMQTQGITPDDIALVAKYVYGRKVGQPMVELGDSLLSHLIFAETLGLSADGCLTSCLNRIQGLDPVKLREKDAQKVAFGLS